MDSRLWVTSLDQLSHQVGVYDQTPGQKNTAHILGTRCGPHRFACPTEKHKNVGRTGSQMWTRVYQGQHKKKISRDPHSGYYMWPTKTQTKLYLKKVDFFSHLSRVLWSFFFSVFSQLSLLVSSSWIIVIKKVENKKRTIQFTRQTNTKFYSFFFIHQEFKTSLRKCLHVVLQIL